MRRSLLYSASPKWRLPAELPRIHAFASKHSEGYGVHTALVQFSTLMAKNLTLILAFKLFNG